MMDRFPVCIAIMRHAVGRAARTEDGRTDGAEVHPPPTYLSLIPSRDQDPLICRDILDLKLADVDLVGNSDLCV